MADIVLFRETANLRTEMELLSQVAQFDKEESDKVEDLRKFASGKVQGWVMDSGIRDFVNTLLSRESLPSQVRVRILRVLALCALRPEFGNFLALDRKERVLMNKARDFESLSSHPEEQKALVLLFCNICGTPEGRDWLTYSYEWGETGESNLMIASNVAALSLVSYTPSLQDMGSGLMLNLASIEVKGIFEDDTLDETDNRIPSYNSASKDTLNGSRIFLTSKATKLSAATMTYSVLKYLSRGVKKSALMREDIVHRVLQALIKFASVIPSEIEEGEAIIPVDWTVIREVSERVGKLTDAYLETRPRGK